MAKQQIKAGFTDYTTLIFIPDPASTDGSGKTGLVAANFTVSGVRVETDNDVTVTDYTSSLNNLAALTTAHTDWGLLEVSSTLAPGLYRLDIADAIFASGAWSAVVYVMITTSAAAASPMEFILVAYDQNDGVRMGLTALPNAAADAAGGLVISDAGGLDADAQRADVAAILVDTGTTLDARIPAALVSGRMDSSVGAMAANVMTAAAAAADLTTELQAGLSTLDAAGVRTAVGLASANLDTQLTAIDDLIDTEVGAIYSRIGAPAGASVSADIAAMKIDTAAILVDTGTTLDARIPAALVSGRMDCSVGAMAANTITAAATASDFTTEVTTGLAQEATLATVAGYLDTEIAAIKAKTDNLPASPAAVGSAMTLTSGERDSIADAHLARNISGGSSTGRTVKQVYHALRNKTSIVAGTLTVTDTDDTTTSWTAAVTTTAGNPISAIDPA